MRSRMVFNYGTELSDALIQGGNAILGGVISEIGGKFANRAMIPHHPEDQRLGWLTNRRIKRK